MKNLFAAFAVLALVVLAATSAHAYIGAINDEYPLVGGVYVRLTDSGWSTKIENYMQPVYPARILGTIEPRYPDGNWTYPMVSVIVADDSTTRCGYMQVCLAMTSMGDRGGCTDTVTNYYYDYVSCYWANTCGMLSGKFRAQAATNVAIPYNADPARGQYATVIYGCNDGSCSNKVGCSLIASGYN